MPKNDVLPDGTTFSSSSRKGSSTHGEDSLHGRHSSQPSQTNEITNKTIGNAENLNAVEKQIPPSKPSSPAPPTELIHYHASISNLEKLLRQVGCNKIPNNYDLRILWSADTNPPITKEKLSELDVEKLYSNLYLRHDLNFDQQIQFSVRNPHDALSRKKKRDAQRFWEALEIEFALHVSHLEGLRLKSQQSSLEEPCSMPAPSTLNEVPLRLSRTVRHMCRIIASLVPHSMESSVKARLNHKMFVQELEHAQCDIEKLFAWIGALLLETCAPSRDAKINDMMETMSQGYRDQDPHLLRHGVQDLFSILEVMKLDATNYQFQLHRNYMLINSIEAEQHQIFRCLKNGWKVPNWLPPAPTSPRPTFTFFVQNLISLITEPTEWTLPAALYLDTSRLLNLRSTFHHLSFRSACTYILNSTLHHLHRPTPLPYSSTQTLSDLITTFDQQPFDLDTRKSLILAIATLASSPNLPAPSTLTHAHLTFSTVLPPPFPYQAAPTTAARAITDTLASKLRLAVAAELKAIDALNLTAMGLANRYTSSPMAGKQKSLGGGAVLPPPLERASGDDCLDAVERRGVEDMARRVAHVAVVHWRVWAPLLYLREGEEKEERVEA